MESNQADEHESSPGSLEDLLALFDELDYDDPFENCDALFGGRVFALSQAEFEDFVDHIKYLEEFDSLPPTITNFDYYAGLLYFKAMASDIHQSLTALFTGTLASSGAYLNLARDKGQGFIPPFELNLNSVLIQYGEGSNKVCKKWPDSAAAGEDFKPLLVVEISYAHRFTRSGLEDRYQRYLTKSNGQIKVVVCVDIYYGSTKDRVSQTAQHLDRSAIAVWTSDKHGQIQKLMDWTPLS